MSIVVSHAPTKNKVEVQAKISSPRPPPIKVLHGLKVPSLALHIPRDGLGEMELLTIVRSSVWWVFGNRSYLVTPEKRANCKLANGIVGLCIMH
jgi:hypothetical protein